MRKEERNKCAQAVKELAKSSDAIPLSKIALPSCALSGQAWPWMERLERLFAHRVAAGGLSPEEV